MESGRLKTILLALMLATASGGAWLYGQAPQGQILGTVVDPSGAPIPEAKVSLRNEATGVQTTMSTTSTGDYVFLYLDSGSYAVTVQKDGFDTAVSSGIKVQVLEKKRVDVQLKVGQVTTRVEVTGAAAKVDTDSATVGMIISRREMTDLPLNGREFSQLATLMPGVQANGTTGGSGIMAGGYFAIALRVGGGTDYSYGGGTNAYTFDGVDNGFTLIGGPAMNPSVDSIQEFRIDRSQAAAEFGNGANQIEVITRSGTNQFHGAAWEYLRNNKTSAGDYYTHVPQNLKRNQYGVNIGGPIEKEKAFFFFNWEGQKSVGVSRQQGTVLTTKMREGDLSEFLPQTVHDPFTGAVYEGNIIPADKIDPVAKSLMDAYMPLPNLGSGIANNYISNFPITDDWNQYVARTDFNPTQKDRLSFRFAGEPRSPLSAGLSATSEPSQVNSDYYAVNAAWQRNLSPNTLVELRLGYHQEKEIQNDIPRKQWANPHIVGEDTTVPGFLYILPYFQHYASWWFPSDYHMKSYDLVANLTHIRGAHTFKLGFQRTTHGWRQPHGPGLDRQEEGFSGQYSGIGVGDYLLGWPFYANTEGYGAFVPKANKGNPVTNLFFQDDWKVRSNLTLNLGIRYDLFKPRESQGDLLSTFDPASGKVVVAGLRIQPTADSATLAAYPNLFMTAAEMGWPLHSMIFENKTDFSPRVGFAFRPWKNNKTVIRGGYGIFYYLRNEELNMYNMVGSPYKSSAPSVVNTTPTPTYTLENPFAAFVGVAPVPNAVSWDPYQKDPYMQQINLGFERELPWGVVAEANFQNQHALKFDNLMNLNQSAPGVSATPYPYMSATLDRDMDNMANLYNALELQLRKNSTHYTFQFSYVLAKNEVANFPDLYVGDIWRGPASYLPTEAKVNFLGDLPVGKGRRYFNHGGVADAVIGGWTASGAFLLHQGGQPMTVGASVQTTNNNVSSIGRPDRICNGKLKNPTIAEWFDTSCFQAAPQNTWGNAGTGILYGPSANMEGDFGLFKNFALPEQLKLQFRTEAFNVFNHPLENYPGTTFGAPATFGIITGKSLTPRVFQFALRLSF
jgi:hypothetical protein